MKDSKKNNKPGKKAKDEVSHTEKPVIEPQSEEHKKIIEFLKTVKFRQQMIGGLDARSVWKKLDELNRLYDEAIRAERIRANALLSEYKKTALQETDKGDATTEGLSGVIAKSDPDANPEHESNHEKG